MSNRYDELLTQGIDWYYFFVIAKTIIAEIVLSEASSRRGFTLYLRIRPIVIDYGWR